jgi:mRNA interferase RelE/StbE
MASFKVIIKQSVAKDLRRIPKKEVESILKRIEALAVEPRRVNQR